MVLKTIRRLKVESNVLEWRSEIECVIKILEEGNSSLSLQPPLI